MRKHLNTLFVTLEDTYLAKDGQTVSVKQDGQVKMRVPLHNLDGIVCMGWKISASPALMGACAEAGLALSFFTPHGKFLATVHGFTAGNVLLRRTQYRVSDDTQASALIAREMVAAKILNCRHLLIRGKRERNADELEAPVKRLARLAKAARQQIDLDALRGTEGEAADTYFQALKHCLVENREAFTMTKRTRRPPLDRMNALLSFLYAILEHDVRSACEGCGLDSAVGFLHRDRPGRPSLALDLMEEFRPILADRLAIALINRKQIQPNDFDEQPTGAVLLKNDARKRILVAFQQRKQEELQHHFLDEKTVIGLLPHLQSRLLARHLRGDLDAYPPFLAR